MCYESSSAPYSHVTNGSRDYGEVHDDWSSSRQTITYRVARDKSRSAKRQRVSVSWFCEWPWSPRELCDNLVRKKPNPSVLIESSLQKLTASGFSKSARQENKNENLCWSSTRRGVFRRIYAQLPRWVHSFVVTANKRKSPDFFVCSIKIRHEWRTKGQFARD